MSIKLGRVDHDWLPQQLLLQIAIEGLKSKSDNLDAEGDFIDCTDWPGVSENEDGTILGWLCAHGALGEGSIALEWI